MEEEIAVINKETYNCNSCGASLKFKPDIDLLDCEYCGNTEEITKKNLKWKN